MSVSRAPFRRAGLGRDADGLCALPVIAIVAMMAFAEPLDPLVFVGGALIFLANWVNLRPVAPPAA